MGEIFDQNVQARLWTNPYSRYIAVNFNNTLLIGWQTTNETKKWTIDRMRMHRHVATKLHFLAINLMYVEGGGRVGKGSNLDEPSAFTSPKEELSIITINSWPQKGWSIHELHQQHQKKRGFEYHDQQLTKTKKINTQIVSTTPIEKKCEHHNHLITRKRTINSQTT